MSGGASAFEERRPLVLARFAYVNTAIFEPSVIIPAPQPKASLSPQDTVSPVAPVAAETSSSDDFRPVLLVAAQTDATQPAGPVEHARAEGAEGIRTIRAIEEQVPPLAPAERHEVRLAALEPAAVLSDLAPDQTVKARTEATNTQPRETRQVRQRSAPRAVHRKSPGAKKVAAARAPRWANKMFDGDWQSHAFSYQ
jgi:hypothetical protein